MALAVSMLKFLNTLFPQPAHPLNMAQDGTKSTAQWQMERGGETLRYFLQAVSERELFEDRVVLDMGCGPGGKTCYYATRGVKKVVGLDLLPDFIAEARALAEQEGLLDSVDFVAADATAMPFADETFDVIIANDFMEHVGDPEGALREAHRVLKKGGRLFVNFPPYYHPYGAHLSDAIAIPWVHSLFSEQTMIDAYKDLVRVYPDSEKRIAFRFSKDAQGREYLSYVNGMTIERFQKILKATPYLKVAYYREAPLRDFLAPLSKINGAKEYFVRMVVVVLEK
ncbi:class I SAM-dependent methyltransferase [Heliorestis acidaminivorans]|uniref:Class I SAM-dependent methyltransferase n=1 Tax=Heliorestis acidaminivorans TaxID=553427 RepID=A0A6I0F153_9FIRM|nr:class I SAM-dependent methyltransferase [Heliorestis acidaminivorans]KAB2953651.1 class I SAM-dependent methyltransferase [Heliorestis acidaminivorans]